MDEREKKISEIVRKVKPSLGVVDEKTILNNGVLDSLDIITIISLLEKEFSVKIAGTCLKQENFESVKTLSDMMEQV